MTPTGKHSRVEECYYHFGRVLTQKGKYLVVLLHLFDKPVPELFREKCDKLFSSLYLSGAVQSRETVPNLKFELQAPTSDHHSLPLGPTGAGSPRL